MPRNLSTLVAVLSLATAPGFALAGPTDTTGAAAPSIVIGGTTTVAAVPTASLPACPGEICPTTGAVTFAPVIADYPPSPCSPDGACTSISVTVPAPAGQ